MKARLITIKKSGNNQVLQMRVLRVLQQGAVALKKKMILDVMSSAPCNCHKVQKLMARQDFFVMGHEEAKLGRLVLTERGVLETWNKKWPKHLEKWHIRQGAHHKGRGMHHDKLRWVYFYCHFSISVDLGHVSFSLL